MKKVFKKGEFVTAIGGLHHSQPNKEYTCVVLSSTVHASGLRQYQVRNVDNGVDGSFDENHVKEYVGTERHLAELSKMCGIG